jgi:hypothetical protein
MRKLVTFVVCVSVFALAVTASVAAAASDGPDQSTAATIDEVQQVPVSTGFQAVEELGCTASYSCVHGTIVSCSSPLVGTCTSSGAQCGQVTCNGVTTRCPGYCYGDHQCFRFCLDQGSIDGYCDTFGCCVCL